MKPRKRYRIRLRDRPWKGVAFALLGVAAVVYSVLDPLDGEVTGGLGGQIHTRYTWAHDPGGFVFWAMAHLLGAIVFSVFIILVLYGEWNMDYLPPRKDPI